MPILELPGTIVRTEPGSPLEVTSERLSIGTVLNYALATADTEYPIALPVGAINIFFNTRLGSLTYATAPGGPYFYVGPMATVELRSLDPAATPTLYVKSSKDNDTLQVHMQT
jgi:hypothetical protein